MKHLFLALCVILIPFLSRAQGVPQPFTHEVETSKKPWTNLDFYNDPMNFQFAFVSDNTGGMRPGVFKKAIGKLNLMMPEFVLSVGDLIQGYTEDLDQIDKEWKEFNKDLEELEVPFFYLPGNHDITNKVMAAEWEERYGRRYYHYTYKGVLFIAMDTNEDDDHNMTDAQTEYIIEAIEKNEDVRWTFVLMHHPIWNYDTDGRFEKVEEALEGRNYSVFAGHTHHYLHEERRGNNYYVLGTTGGGSALRGHRFGEFDHVTWVTMTDHGPTMANLRLDGILDHSVSNVETRDMAESILRNNASSKRLILTNTGKKFKNGTLYLHYDNPTEHPLSVTLNFYHHHEVGIDKPDQMFELEPGAERTVEIQLSALRKLDFSDLGFLKYHWKIQYMDEEYADFNLEGDQTVLIEPSVPDYFYPEAPQFFDKVNVEITEPFAGVHADLTIEKGSGQVVADGSGALIDDSSVLEMHLTNERGEKSLVVSESYDEIAYLSSISVKNPKVGMQYSYYEGNWTETIPTLTSETPKKKGIAQDLYVDDISDRDHDFCIVYEGYLDVDSDQIMQFRCNADDAAIMYVDGVQVCQEGQSAEGSSDLSAGLSFGNVALRKGYHQVRIVYHQQKDGSRLRLYVRNSEQVGWKFMKVTDFFTY